MRKNAWIRQIRSCERCSLVFTETFPGKRFCTQLCAVLAHNQSIENREKVKAALIGRQVPWVKGKKLSNEQREIRRVNNLGSKSHFWKGGVSAEHKVIRQSLAFTKWREAVFTRDDHRCYDCGKRGGVELHPDHLYPFATFPRLRFMVENGRTLCAPCHRKTSTYANGARLGKHTATGMIFR